MVLCVSKNFNRFDSLIYHDTQMAMLKNSLKPSLRHLSFRITVFFINHFQAQNYIFCSIQWVNVVFILQHLHISYTVFRSHDLWITSKFYLAMQSGYNVQSLEQKLVEHTFERARQLIVHKSTALFANNFKNLWSLVKKWSLIRNVEDHKNDSYSTILAKQSWEKLVLSWCFLKYRDENIRSEPSDYPFSLNQCC